MKDTIKSDIVHYLEEQGGWIFGGVLGRTLRELTGHKESIIERRARELVNEGKILNSYEQIEGKGPRCVKYRIAPEMPLERTERPQNDIFHLPVQNSLFVN